MKPETTDEVTPDGKTFRCTVVCPKSVPEQLGQEEFERQVWNETLSRAHAQMLMPVGSIFIGSSEDVDPDEGEVQGAAMPEGIRFDTTHAGRIDMGAFMQGFLGGGHVSIPMIRVVAEVSLVQESRGGE